MDLTAIDSAAFARDVDALHAELMADLGPADIAHLHKMNRWSRACTITGYATAWIAPNPVSVIAMSLGTLSRWITMHHVGHRGYDRVPDMPRKLTSKVFAKGWRRYFDWFDWMHPEAWNHEHNNLHHPRTGEDADPDLVERNAEWLRDSSMPKIMKVVIATLIACTWRFSYYAPNTIRELHRAKRRRAGDPDPTSQEEALRQLFNPKDPEGRAQWMRVLNPATVEGRQLWLSCLLPYAALRFVVIPAAFYAISPWAAFSVLVNSLLAEVLTNLHAFAVIVPNHAGGDVPRFDGASRDKPEFFVRQVAGSVNFTGGTDVKDFLQGYLNYQIEHHVWPDLPMLKYRQAQPKLQAIAAKHGVPYIREGVGTRVAKMVSVMIGSATMPRGITAPAEMERSTPSTLPLAS